MVYNPEKRGVKFTFHSPYSIINYKELLIS